MEILYFICGHNTQIFLIVTKFVTVTNYDDYDDDDDVKYNESGNMVNFKFVKTLDLD